MEEFKKTKTESGSTHVNTSSQRLIFKKKKKKKVLFLDPSAPVCHFESDSCSRADTPLRFVRSKALTWRVSFSRLVRTTSSCTSGHCGLPAARYPVGGHSPPSLPCQCWRQLGCSGATTVWHSLRPLLTSANLSPSLTLTLLVSTHPILAQIRGVSFQGCADRMQLFQQLRLTVIFLRAPVNSVWLPTLGCPHSGGGGLAFLSPPEKRKTEKSWNAAQQPWWICPWKARRRLFKTSNVEYVELRIASCGMSYHTGTF